MSSSGISKEQSDYLLTRGLRIDKEIGRGGMGLVLLAQQQSLGRPVAVKVLLQSLSSPKDLIRFRSEGRSLLRVQHPNVVRVFDVAFEPPVPHLVMEYVADSQPLFDRLQDCDFDKATRLDIVMGVLEGLAAVHQHSLIHRDLKPGNILIDRANIPRLIDFGLSRSLNANETRATQSGAVLGTLAYMSPEQLRGEELGLQSDVYSFALIAIEILAGRLIFSDGGDRGAEYPYFERISRGVPPISKWCADLDPAVQRQLTRCLEERAADRPASAIEILKGWPPPKGAPTPGDKTERVVEPLGAQPLLRPSVKKRTLELRPATPTPVEPPEESSRVSKAKIGFLLIAGAGLLTILLYRHWGQTRGRAVRPDAGPIAVRAAEVVASGNALFLRIKLASPQPATLKWQADGRTASRTAPTSEEHQIELSTEAGSRASHLRVELGSTELDLKDCFSAYVAGLTKQLVEVPVDRLIKRIAILRSQGRAPADFQSEAAKILTEDVARDVRVSGSVVRSWFEMVGPCRQRSESLAAVYRLELAEEFLRRVGVHGFLPASSLLPTGWAERSFGGDSATNPRLNLKGAVRKFPSLAVSINGVQSKNDEPVVATDAWSYMPFRCDLKIDRKFDPKQTDLFGSQKQKGTPRTWKLGVAVPDELIGSRKDLTVCLGGRSTGDTVLWVDINRAVQIPFFMGGGERNLAITQNRDCMRTCPGGLLRAGSNLITLSLEPFPGLPEIEPAWCWWVYLMPGLPQSDIN